VPQRAEFAERQRGVIELLCAAGVLHAPEPAR
jgi:hypothetical protein